MKRQWSGLTSQGSHNNTTHSGQSVALSGYNSGSNEKDVTFDIQRFCPGVSGNYGSSFLDNYMVIGSVTGVEILGNDPCKQTRPKHTQRTTHGTKDATCKCGPIVTAISTPACIALLQTGGALTKTRSGTVGYQRVPTRCRRRALATPTHQTTRSGTYVGVQPLSTCQMVSHHRTITINAPQKACWKGDDACGSDWRAPYCNAAS